MSPPLVLRAGDATAHDALTLHSAPPNLSEDFRWVYQCAYIPAETLYTGAPKDRHDQIDLTVNEPLEHPFFPIVGAWPPS